MKDYQKNLLVVLERLKQNVMDDPDFSWELADSLEPLLDEYASMDGFGTECQCDPRGDGRVRSDWSIWGEVQ